MATGSGPQRGTARRTWRVAVALGLAVLAAGIGAAVGLGASESADDARPTTIVDLPETASVPTSTATTTTPPNDLLAPPPTVVPMLQVTDGMAPLVRRVQTTDRVIFITIDDGQVRQPSYLEHFSRLGVPFSTFLLQTVAKADPDFWRATMQRGGSIQAHTINHPNLRTTSEAVARREICEPADTFTTLFGTRPTLFRPPYGNSNDMVRRIANECGYRAVVLWSGSTNDGKLTMQDVFLQPGDIVLMHYRDTLNEDLDDVVARARAEGFRIGRLEDYLVPR